MELRSLKIKDHTVDKYFELLNATYSESDLVKCVSSDFIPLLKRNMTVLYTERTMKKMANMLLMWRDGGTIPIIPLRIIIPVNLGNEHWVTVMVRTDVHHMVWFDSMDESDTTFRWPPAARFIFEGLVDLFGKISEMYKNTLLSRVPWIKTRGYFSKSQTDGHSCGIYLMAAGRMCCENQFTESYEIQLDDIAEERSMILQEIRCSALRTQSLDSPMHDVLPCQFNTFSTFYEPQWDYSMHSIRGNAHELTEVRCIINPGIQVPDRYPTSIRTLGKIKFIGYGECLLNWDKEKCLDFTAATSKSFAFGMEDCSTEKRGHLLSFYIPPSNPRILDYLCYVKEMIAKMIAMDCLPQRIVVALVGRELHKRITSLPRVISFAQDYTEDMIEDCVRRASEVVAIPAECMQMLRAELFGINDNLAEIFHLRGMRSHRLSLVVASDREVLNCSRVVLSDFHDGGDDVH